MKNLLMTSAALLALMLSPLAQAADAASAAKAASKPSTQHATGVPAVASQAEGQQPKSGKCE